MYKFKLKQDNLIVAKGESDYKEQIFCEAGHYFDMYEDEDYNKMSLTIEYKKGE